MYIHDFWLGGLSKYSHKTHDLVKSSCKKILKIQRFENQDIV